MIAGLPYDAEVEYLRNTGLTQYIDTGVLGGEGLRVVADITPRQIANDIWAIGSYDANARIYVAYQYNNTQSGSGGYWGGGYGNYFSGSTVLTVDKKISLDVEYTPDYQILKIDGVETERFAKSGFTGTISHTLYLFGLHYNDGNTRSFLCDIGSVQIYMGSVLVRDFIPVRFTNSNGQSEGAMYDRVSRKLFRNAGTGSFTIGPDVATPVMGLHFFKSQIKTAKDYVQNGLISMWDGIENAGWGTHDPNVVAWKDLAGTSDWGLLTGIGTQNAFEVGADYVKILSAVNYIQLGYPYNGNGHCIPSWSSDDEIKQMEIVLDNTDFSESSASRICSFGVGSGGFTSQMVIRDSNIFQFGYHKYPVLQLSTGLNAISFDRDTQRGVFNGVLTDSTKSTVGSPYAYSCPVLSAYAAQAAIGIKIKALRIYSRVLSEVEMLANYRVDKLRFNFPSS